MTSARGKTLEGRKVKHSKKSAQRTTALHVKWSDTRHPGKKQRVTVVKLPAGEEWDCIFLTGKVVTIESVPLSAVNVVRVFTKNGGVLWEPEPSR